MMTSQRMINNVYLESVVTRLVRYCLTGLELSASARAKARGSFRLLIWGCFAALAFSLVATPARADADSTAITIYSSAQPGAVPPEIYQPGRRAAYANLANLIQMIPGYAIVKQERDVTLAQGRSTIRFSDVASQIDPTTVTFLSLTDGTGTSVLEQNFEFDLVSTDKLMQRFIDKQVTIEQAHGDAISTFTGKLLSTAGGVVLQSDDGSVRVLSGYSNVQFPELPGGLITKPTLVWDVAATRGGEHRTRVSYETKGIAWWADYNIIFSPGADANSGMLDIGAWVSIINQTGATYEDAKLKLIAGDVNRAPQPQQRVYAEARMARSMSKSLDNSGFEEKSFFEYHLYTLGRATTLPDNSTKQIELFPTARNVPCEKVLVYLGQSRGSYGNYGQAMTDRNFGLQSNKKVDIYIRLKNEKKIGMGMPLPAGRIRVSQLDKADGSLEFIGEDTIDHTPKDEEVLIKMGSAFDVVGERRQVDFKVDSNRKWMEETIEIKLRNHKDEPVKVIAKETLYRWTNWQILDSSHKYEKQDARTIYFPVTIEPDGEVTIEYKVKYTW